MVALFIIYVAVFTYLADWCVPARTVPFTAAVLPAVQSVHPLTPPSRSYGMFASSALAGQSLSRTSRGHSLLPLHSFHALTRGGHAGNIMGTVYPLFTTQMFDALGYPIGATVFACVAVLMVPIPFVRLATHAVRRPELRSPLSPPQVLFWKGPAIRARSKFASQVVHTP